MRSIAAPRDKTIALRDALRGAGRRPRYTTDDEWLLIAFERTAFDASQDGPAGLEACERYGILRYEIISRLGWAPQSKEGLPE